LISTKIASEIEALQTRYRLASTRAGAHAAASGIFGAAIDDGSTSSQITDLTGMYTQMRDFTSTLANVDVGDDPKLIRKAFQHASAIADRIPVLDTLGLSKEQKEEYETLLFASQRRLRYLTYARQMAGEGGDFREARDSFQSSERYWDTPAGEE
jgi:hypothetical protein